jgi:hypothetical protein
LIILKIFGGVLRVSLFIVQKVVQTFHVWWYMYIILALRKLRQEDHKFEASLGYIVSLKPA